MLTNVFWKIILHVKPFNISFRVEMINNNYQFITYWFTLHFFI